MIAKCWRKVHLGNLGKGNSYTLYLLFEDLGEHDAGEQGGRETGLVV